MRAAAERPPSESKILARVEQLEFCRQIARELAGLVCGELDANELLTRDPDQNIDEVLAAYVALLQPFVAEMGEAAAAYAADLGLEKIEQEAIEEVATEEIGRFLEEVRPELYTAIGRSLRRLQEALDEGVDGEAIQQAMATEDTPKSILAPFARVLRAHGGEMMVRVEKRVGALAYAAGEDDD